MGYDNRPLYTNHKYRGIGNYCRNILEKLEGGLAGELSINKLVQGDHFNIPMRPMNRELYLLSNLLYFPFLPKDLDLIHITDKFGPLISQKPYVTTIYDVIPLVFFEEMLKGRHLGQLYSYLQKVTARNAQRIITLSEHSKRDIIKHYRVSEDKIDVIPLATDFIEKISGFEYEQLDVGIKYSIHSPYILTTSSLQHHDPRKDIVSLMRAVKILSAESSLDFQLVIAGKKGEYYERLYKFAIELDVVDRVIFTDYVSEFELYHLYKNAATFVYPSLYEGFGIPLLEAMASGTPVVAYNNSSIPEVVGNHGYLINNKDEAALADAIRYVLSSPSDIKRTIEEARVYAETFSWERTSQLTYQSYKRALNSI